MDIYLECPGIATVGFVSGFVSGFVGSIAVSNTASEVEIVICGYVGTVIGAYAGCLTLHH